MYKKVYQTNNKFDIFFCYRTKGIRLPEKGDNKSIYI